MSASFFRPQTSAPPSAGNERADPPADMYRRIFQHAPEAILVISTEGDILEANPAACRILSATAEQLRQHRFDALFPPTVTAQLASVFQAELVVGSLFLRLPMRSLSGARFTVELTLRQLESDQGTFLLAYIEDVSERQRIEHLLQRHESVLEATRHIARRLLHTPRVEDVIPEVLEHLGRAFLVDRVCLFQNLGGEAGSPRALRVAQWHNASAAYPLEACPTGEVPYASQGLRRWMQLLASGTAIHGTLADFPIHEQQFLLRRAIKSLLVVPIFVGEQWWGFLSVQHCCEETPWNSNDIESLQIIADMLGGAIQRQRVESALRERQTAMGILQRITADALRDTPTQETLNALAVHLSTLVHADACFITLWDEERQRPVPAAAYGALERTYPSIRPFDDRPTLTHIALEREETLLIEDVKSSPLIHPRWLEIEDVEHIRSMLVIPLLANRKRLGAALLAFNRKRSFTENEQRDAEQATQQIALALAKTQLLRATRRQLDELRTLHQASMAATLSVDENFLLRNFAEIIGRAFYREHFAIWLLEEDGKAQTLRSVYHEGALRPEMQGVRYTLDEGIIGHVARSGETYCSGNACDDERYIRFNPAMRSEICVPIQAGERILGVLNAESARRNAFDETDERLLNTLASQLGTALMKVRLLASERQRRKEAEALQQASRALVASLDLDEVLHNIMVLLQRVVPYDSASIVILEENGKVPRMMMCSGYQADMQITPPEDLLSRPHIRRMLHNQEPVLLPDTAAESDTWIHIPGTEYIRCWLGVPLVVQERVIGWLNIDKQEPHYYTPATAQLALAFASQAAVALENARLYNELETSYLQTVLALARAMDARDSYTADHSNSLAQMARAVAERMGCEAEDIQAIEWAAILHDIGKIGVPDHILRKPGALSEDEWAIMKRHPDIGAEIIAPVQRLKRVAPIVRAHQEKFDGSGYPRGLRGEEIPLGARILAVVDAYSAITDERVYRKGRPHSEAVEELRRCSGSHFDPRVVDIFLDIMQQRGAF